MSRKEDPYYRRRAEEEVELAQRSTDPVVVQFHYAMTELYLEKLYGSPAGTPDVPDTQLQTTPRDREARA